MATGTAPQDVGMIDPVYREPNVSVVAVLANICRLYVVSRLAGRITAIVATGAAAGDTGMVESCRRPRARAVAVVAIVAAGNMID